jgi:NAD(P)-dependent dehydrogenase (short-subunit alcohol dehydrogenase family)
MTRENEPVEHLTERDPAAPRTIVITGSSSGIGLAAAEEMTRRGWSVAIVGRNPDRLAQALDRVRAAGGSRSDAASAGKGASAGSVAAYQCDFNELKQVRELAASLRSAYPRIDVLANNAGGILYGSTVDGYPAMMQANHLAHFLLSHELRDQLRGGRIINTSSDAHRSGRLDPTHPWQLGSPIPMRDYGTAKQANILFAVEAARRWPDIVSAAFHPGVVKTNFGSTNVLIGTFFKFWPFLRTPEQGARTLVWLATTEPSNVRSGAYYQDMREARPTARSTDPTAARLLWESSLSAVGLAESTR